MKLLQVISSHLFRRSQAVTTGTRRSLTTSGRVFKKKEPSVKQTSMKDTFEAMDKPVKYSKSKASDWKSVDSFMPPIRDVPWYQPPVVAGSVAIFLIYFLFLREENDLDTEIATSLYDRIPGLEEQQLRASIEYAIEKGEDPTPYRTRLAEIVANK